MRTPSIALAFVASFTAAFIIGVHAMPPNAVMSEAAASGSIVTAQVPAPQGSRSRDRDDRYRDRYDNRARDRYDRRPERRQFADCHRDVRTHRINGALVTHRHVGSNCSVRAVRRSSEPAPRR
ncbi:hypothetical protein [Mesorhizobium sp. CAU 1741]|uniref:hypothetical protein n=1 Tax=Mesorhizobium sp. CAU 1741 TaxID=3140366 RepID=UPI00325ADF4B